MLIECLSGQVHAQDVDRSRAHDGPRIRSDAPKAPFDFAHRGRPEGVQVIPDAHASTEELLSLISSFVDRLADAAYVQGGRKGRGRRVLRGVNRTAFSSFSFFVDGYLEAKMLRRLLCRKSI